MKFTIVKATTEELAEILDIFAYARTTIAALGIPQWQNGYPSRSVIEADMAGGRSYAVKEGDEVKATFVLVDHEPDYDVIYGGKWLAAGKYTALHRIAVAGDCRGSGISAFIMDFVKEEAIRRGAISLRCDTHEGNLPMRRMLEKNGFVHCGEIHLSRALREGDSDYRRVGYECLL